ncbi:hypothetical protein CsatB_008566 [Cannabis sativa]
MDWNFFKFRGRMSLSIHLSSSSYQTKDLISTKHSVRVSIIIFLVRISRKTQTLK